MKAIFADRNRHGLLLIVGVTACSCLCGLGLSVAQQTAANKAPTTTSAPATAAKSFASPQQAADALLAAAENFDENALEQLFGPSGDDIYLTGEYPQDRRRAADPVAARPGCGGVQTGDQTAQTALRQGRPSTATAHRAGRE